MSGRRNAKLTISHAGGADWRLSLRGGADNSAGAAAAADCELQAEGPLSGDRIQAKVVPFEGETSSVTAADLARNPAAVTVTLDGDAARVSTDYAGCGVGADLSGPYTRQGHSSGGAKGMSVLTEGASLDAAQAAYPHAALKVVDGYPWARFAVEGGPVLTFDGENEDLKDGSNSQKRIGQTVQWSDLKPGLKVTRIEQAG